MSRPTLPVSPFPLEYERRTRRPAVSVAQDSRKVKSATCALRIPFLSRHTQACAPTCATWTMKMRHVQRADTEKMDILSAKPPFLRETFPETFRAPFNSLLSWWDFEEVRCSCTRFYILIKTRWKVAPEQMYRSWNILIWNLNSFFFIDITMYIYSNTWQGN